MASRIAYGAFRRLNRWTTVPLLRAGTGAWLGSPIGGWLLLLRVTGRRTGLAREVPLSYLIAEGSVWVMSGFGPRAQWYRNLLADPVVEVILPGRVVRCRAEDVTDPETRRRIIPRLARAIGVPGYLGGFDPYRSTADRILAATAWVPLIRLRPEGTPLAAGPDDPGGLGWIWRQVVVLAAAVWLARLLAARFRRPT